MKYAIKNRWTGKVIFEAEIGAEYENSGGGMKLGAAVKVAVKAGANLADAYLVGAYLVRAYLAGANLVDANLVGANLADANLAGANLVDANLVGANLADANLAGANLAGAYLARAYLARAYLAGANLAGAYLAGAYLAGAKWRNGITINRAPLQLYGLRWSVTILDKHMQIGCELHTLAEWAAFDDRRILEMDGKEALTFWRAHKDALLALAKGDGRGVEKGAAA